MASCECCGSPKEVSTEISLIANIPLDLCRYCVEQRHTPKWLIDGVIDENGGLEFCPDWLRNAIQHAKYCSVRSEE